MKKVLFLHDTNILNTGGAELSILKIIQSAANSGFNADWVNIRKESRFLNDFHDADILVINNIFFCSKEFELIEAIIDSGIPYIRWEHDYGFCSRRDAICHVNKRVKYCCSRKRVELYRRLFKNAKLNVFQSPLHYQIHFSMYGKIIHPYIVLPPPVSVSQIAPSPKIWNTVAYVGRLDGKKGCKALQNYANSNPEKAITIVGSDHSNLSWPSNVVLRGELSQRETFQILGEAESFFFNPVWPEPSSRAFMEAFLSRCKMIYNDRVGASSYPFFPTNYNVARKAMSRSPVYFWECVDKALHRTEIDHQNKIILITKSFGGLGDFILAYPAIKKVWDAYSRIHVYCPDPLYDVFKNSDTSVKFHKQSTFQYHVKHRSTEFRYIDIHNYPSIRGSDTGNHIQLKYSTYRKVRQHAYLHYIDALSRHFPYIVTGKREYTHLKLKHTVNTQNALDTVVIHSGAGYLKKCWPLEKFCHLIKNILELFQNISISILIGKNDPNPLDLNIVKDTSRISLLSGATLLDISEQLHYALCFIGNDSGISHLAGAFNIPSVVIHGPTGPGTWSSCAIQKKIVYGKTECDKRCTYKQIQSCEEISCLTTIRVEQVLEAFMRIIGENRSEIMNMNTLTYVINPLYKLNMSDDSISFSHISNSQEFTIHGSLALLGGFIEDMKNGIEYHSVKHYSRDIQDLINAFVESQVLLSVPTRLIHMNH